jgi:drug/metabolite transporter (DMT)-like permease
MVKEHRSSNKSTLIMSLLFILLYSSGFVAAKIGLSYAPPLIFLAVRFALTVAILAVIALILKAPWPKSWRMVFHVSIAGLLLVGVFSVGTWVSISMGLPPAISALIIALQPLLVAISAHFLLKEEVGLQQWIGFILGLIGVALVVGEGVSFSPHYLAAVLLSVLGLVGVSAGSLYQKKFCSNMNVFTGGIIQSGVSGIICLILATGFESFSIQWSGRFIFALFWMSVVVSIGAISLLYLLLRTGKANKVSSIFYLVPVVTAIIAYFVFGSILTYSELIGMAITVIGVSFVNIKFNSTSSKGRPS